ncbi:MAG: 50S ribosomal protein L32 [Myxococcales bacterium]|nr:50S ribosomal protein L32 [Myxococcales bacterium]
MAVPKRRTSRTKRDMRRANHDKVSAPGIVRCPNCGEVKLPHRVCGACGFYDGQQVVAKATPAAEG